MAPNPNIKRAFKAMKDLGIEEAIVKPVLKNLLVIYDKNWELIAEDNFRALADAIFEEQEAEDIQARKGKKKVEEEEPRAVEVNREKKKAPEPEDEEEDVLAEPVHPLKRQRRRGEGGSAQTLNSSTSPSYDVPVVKEPIVQTTKQKSPSTYALIVPKDEPFTDDMPLNVIHPDSLGEGSSSVPVLDVGNMNGNANNVPPEQKGEIGCIASNAPPSAAEKSSEHMLVAVSEESSAVEVACSPLGDVKLTLSFSPATAGLNLRLPSLDELRRAMEEKCLRSYKILDPNFSVLNFMNDMCSCYLELATNSANQSPEKLPYITPNLNILKKSAGRCSVFPSGTKDTICQMQGRRGVENKEVGGLSENMGGADYSDSRGLVVVPECQISADDWRSINSFNDITQGEEMVEIPWVNGVNNELLPPIHYIAQSLVFQNASVKFTLSNIRDDQCCSSCFGDCLASPMPCSCAIAVSGFAYTLDGLLKEEFLEECISVVRDPQNQCRQMCKQCPLEKAKKESILEPCKGHLKRKVIKECWSKCGCNTNCGNRVVQRRIHSKLQVFFTPDGKGWGLRTLEKLPKGAFVCEFAGEILTIAELYQRGSEKCRSPVILDAYWGSEDALGDDKALCLDGSRYGNVARFINHRCLDANLIEVPVHIETPDHHYYHLAFFSTREVEEMEELTWDYGIDFSDHDHPMKTFQCLCGSKFCRNMKGANKAKNVVNTT